MDGYYTWQIIQRWGTYKLAAFSVCRGLSVGAPNAYPVQHLHTLCRFITYFTPLLAFRMA
jgi:hypothetical protein